MPYLAYEMARKKGNKTVPEASYVRTSRKALLPFLLTKENGPYKTAVHVRYLDHSPKSLTRLMESVLKDNTETILAKEMGKAWEEAFKSETDLVKYMAHLHKNYVDEDKAKAVEKAQVNAMRDKVSVIAHKRNLDGSKYAKNFSKGKRVDHDSLPDEIKALYVENLSLLQSMREDHLQLRRLVLDKNVTCLDAEQFPFLKDIIEKDERMHENWKKYDEYGANALSAEDEMAEEEKNRSLKAFRMLNMCKGQYKKKRTEAKKQQILELLSQIIDPPKDLIDELAKMGIEYEKNS